MNHDCGGEGPPMRQITNLERDHVYCEGVTDVLLSVV